MMPIEDRAPCRAHSTTTARRKAMPQPVHQTRIIKKLAPGDAGTKRLSQRFGKDLVCVRYRQDRDGDRRYTTVEVVVDSGPMPAAAMPKGWLLVRLAWNETDLRKAAARLGAVWDEQARAWRMSQEAVQALHVSQRVISK